MIFSEKGSAMLGSSETVNWLITERRGLAAE